MIESVGHFVDRICPSFGRVSVQTRFLELFGGAASLDERAGMGDGASLSMAEFALLHGNDVALRALLAAGARMPSPPAAPLREDGAALARPAASAAL